MDHDFDYDLQRWGSFGHIEYQTKYRYIDRVAGMLNSSGLQVHQRNAVLEGGISIGRELKKKYKKKIDILDRVKRFLNPYPSKAFGCLQQKISPRAGDVLEDISKSYLVHSNKNSFFEIDKTIKDYFGKQEYPDSAYAVSYSLKQNPVVDMKEAMEILTLNYIKKYGKYISERDIGGSAAYFMLLSNEKNREDRTNNSIEEVYINLKYAVKGMEGSSYWLVSPKSYMSILKYPIWGLKVKENKINSMLKIIDSLSCKLDYWNKKYLKGDEIARKVLENLGKFCYENYDRPENIEFFVDMTKIFPRKSDEISKDIYEDLSDRNLNPRVFEKRAEEIVLAHKPQGVLK
ncbi:MAG: hypothetical protein ACOC85_04235 [Thermoplasmatota archaeon]